MMARRFFLQSLRLGTLAILLGAVALPADVAAQLPASGSDPETPAAPADADAPAMPDPRLLTPREMVSLAEVYSYEIASAVANVETLRKDAVAARDAIKASCIDLVLPEMHMIRDSLAPRFKTIADRNDEFVARADFLVIPPGVTRIRELRAEAEACVGQEIDSSSVFSIGTETPPGPNADSTATTAPNDVVVDRPAEASIYR
ncbi:MAG TPA: hypothetical protein VMU50_21060 [Polyangia bacterium]|nr:hypothetical protein [Polyangia bacterium]